MVSVNTVLIGGHLGADPEDRRTASGKLTCNFRLATNRWDSQKEEEVAEWHSIVCYEKTADLCLKYLHKGSAVLVEGRLHERTWEGTDGKRNYRTEIVAARVTFLSSSRGAPSTPIEPPRVAEAEVATPPPGEPAAAPARERAERRSRRERGAFGDEAIPF